MYKFIFIFLLSFNVFADGYFPMRGKVIGKSDYDQYLVVKDYGSTNIYKIKFNREEYNKFKNLEFVEGNFLVSNISFKKKGQFRYKPLIWTSNSKK